MLERIPRINYAIHPAYGGLFGRSSLITRARALCLFMPHFLNLAKKTARWHLARRRSSFVPAEHPEAQALYQRIVQHGAATICLDDEEKIELRRFVAPYRAAVEERIRAIPPERRSFDQGITAIPRKAEKQFYAYLSSVLERRHVFAVGRHYRNLPVALGDVVLQINEAGERHWRDHFSDIGFSDPPTAYFHHDSTIKQLKCLLYLSEVTSETGPFSYVLGSNRFRSGIVEYLARRANDRTKFDKCDREHRKLFWALPWMFRHKSEFGNDYLEGGAGAGALLAAERRFLSREADIIFFDTDGVHRGGMVESGKRCILQIRLRQMM